MRGLRRFRRPAMWAVAACSATAIWAAAIGSTPRPFREYPGMEYNDFPKPADYGEKTEWAFARLMYPDGNARGFGFRRGGDWREGYTWWTQDYPRADRHFAQAIRRLTRLHV